MEEKSGFVQPRVDRLQYALSEDDKGLVVTGKVVNNDTIAFPRVTVSALFRGDFGQTVGVSKTELQGLAPKEPREFTIVHPMIAHTSPLKADVFVVTQRP